MEYEALNRERQFKERALAYAGLAYKGEQRELKDGAGDHEEDIAE